jgi:hypothetical protein
MRRGKKDAAVRLVLTNYVRSGRSREDAILTNYQFRNLGLHQKTLDENVYHDPRVAQGATLRGSQQQDE